MDDIEKRITYANSQARQYTKLPVSAIEVPAGICYTHHVNLHNVS